MAYAIEDLTREHRVIEEMLGSLETFIESLGTYPERERRDVAGYVRFFREFVDRCHHGKEENYLFVKMRAYGFSETQGPVSAMLSEQGEGKEHLNALESIGAGQGPLDPRERGSVRGHALGYIMRIRPHMAREEDILFPIIVHSLPGFVIDDLGRDFRYFEKNVLPPDFHRNLQAISGPLIATYPPKQKKEQPPVSQ